MKKQNEPLIGLPKRDQKIMSRLLQTPPDAHKTASKPATIKGEAQRRRRDKERASSSEASRDV